MAPGDDKKDEKIGRSIHKVWSEAELLLKLCKTQAGLDLLPPSPGLAAALHGASFSCTVCLPDRRQEGQPAVYPARGPWESLLGVYPARIQHWMGPATRNSGL